MRTFPFLVPKLKPSIMITVPIVPSVADISAGMPVPVMGTLTSEALEVISNDAAFAPTDVGVKVTFCVHVAKGSRVAPQVVVPLVN